MWRLRALLVCLAFPSGAEVVVFPAPDGGERELVVYSSLDSPLARPLVEAFQRQRPDVTVRYEDLLTGEIAERVVQETDAGGKPTADLVFSSAMDVTVKLANDGYAREADVPGAAAWPDWAAWRSMVFALTFEPGVIVYHRPSFPDGPPDTRAALIDWLETAPKGQIGTYDIARSAVGYLYLMRDQEHFADLWPLVRAMGRAGVQTFPTSQDVIDGVNSGQLKLGYNVLGSYAADQASRLPDIGLVLPRDYVVVISRVALVPRAAANPDLGEAFLEFLMSREGQTVLAERLRLPAVSLEVRGKDSAAAMQEALGAKLRPVAVSPGLLAYLDAASRARVLAEWNAALEGGE
ncbi:ABC transporter substrate-binding protein [Tabrizicola sp.]|uniref:ABC transporter substrate-binding protein n=1 Tax=Tabrizicola sp. TaxID=2005166 RepID=UPI002736A6C3|nr:ABC transporter substrate-binding protein [Tabrizicola sp.]MDP3193665.1 ABC transporter substrate-binding protein [Tabrizicola sp.]